MPHARLGTSGVGARGEPSRALARPRRARGLVRTVSAWDLHTPAVHWPVLVSARNGRGGQGVPGKGSMRRQRHGMHPLLP